MEQKTTYALYIEGCGYINKSVEFDYHRIVTDHFDWQNDFYFIDNLTEKTLEFKESELAKDFVNLQINLHFTNGSAGISENLKLWIEESRKNVMDCYGAMQFIDNHYQYKFF